MADGEPEGRWLEGFPRLAGAIASVPVTLGFIALGATVLLSRSLLELVELASGVVRNGNGANGRRNGSAPPG